MYNLFRALIAVTVFAWGVSPARVDAATTMTGMWVNTTFGSSGAVTITFEIAGMDFSGMIDVDGAVFGGSDPPPITVSGMIDGTGTIMFTLMDDPVFGDFTGTIDPMGAVAASMTDVPSPFIDHVMFMGTVSPTGLIVDYVVFFEPTPAAGTATGFVTAVVVPLPAAFPLLGSAIAAGAWLRGRRPNRSAGS
jgi:hypothetical protein